jgi:probable FeS assembly SUF system protein SufT
MQTVTALELKRDCPAVQIPAGNTVVLPAGTPVELTQTLGGSFTIQALGALFRIAAPEADALGLDVATTATPPPPSDTAAASGRLDERQIWDVLKTCYDPEIPVNIVDLGLVYDLRLEPLPSGRSRVAVKMTLTAPGCGMGSVIARDAQEKILCLDSVEEADVQIVWDPPWHPSMISAAGRARLGLD